MNIYDILILLLVAAALFFALRHMIRARRSGGCGCGCSGCSGGECPRRDARGGR